MKDQVQLVGAFKLVSVRLKMVVVVPVVALAVKPAIGLITAGEIVKYAKRYTLSEPAVLVATNLAAYDPAAVNCT